ncbi:inosine 5'-monophosphate dehydrogenase [Planctomycetes bacterium Pan216]|uniref:Inosine 5'-monophosphate dehydrogenase n=1 Tax=Kolteria novifilia TaxID=2527975 RepID=A0A518AX79_9BACT|nr:inosine 5'-monophosphate dehydrogenase [Planctomycetes bacterium Pan216]
MSKPFLAKDIMVTSLVTLSPKMDVYEAIDVLLRHKISGAPVVDEKNHLLGAFSERGCMAVMIRGAVDVLPSAEVEAFMQPRDDVETITEETHLLTIAQIFIKTHARRLPVLRGEKLVGQVSRRDVVKAARELIHDAPEAKSAFLYLSAINERQHAPI